MNEEIKPGTWVRTDCPVPQRRQWCPMTIYRLVHTHPGIDEIRYDTVHRRFDVDFDPERMSEDEARAAFDELAAHLDAAPADCLTLFRGRRIDVDTGLERDCTAMGVPGSADMVLRDGILHVPQSPAAAAKNRPPEQRGRRWVTRTISRTPPAGEASRGWLPRLWAWLVSSREPLFVAGTAIALISAVITERMGRATASSLLYLVAYLFGGYFGVRAGIDSLREKKIDIDLLMVLAALGAAAVGAPFEGALLLFLFSLSNVLQEFALDRTRSAIKALAKLKPDSAIVLDHAQSEHGRSVAVDEIPIGAWIQVRPGDRIALDGVVERGASSVDQASITGESMPVDKAAGSTVLAGSINQDGELVVRVTKRSSESTIAKIITLVEEAQEQQAKTERFLDRFEQYYAVVVILATVGAAVLPPLLGTTPWPTALYRAITLMVAASPCALIISTPASILSAIGNAARRGILFKGGVHVEQAANIQAVAFDKTGTLTEGKPVVADVVPSEDWTAEQVLAAAASLESKSEHVLAAAITAEARRREIAYESPTEFRNESGVGVRATVQGRTLQLGSPALLDRNPQLPDPFEQTRAEIHRLQSEAKTVVVLMDVRETAPPRVLGLIALEDRLRDGVREVVQDLRDAGIRHVAMLTGDNSVAAQRIAAEAGIDVVFAELLPEHKLDAIRRIETEYGPTAMVGDGVNDAPALAGARLGIAMGAAGTDVALETADVVLLSDDLEKIPYLIELSRRTKRTLIVNISVALALIAMMIVGIYTIDLPLPLAVVGHEGGTVLVSLNGVRLLLFRRRRRTRRVRRSPGAPVRVRQS